MSSNAAVTALRWAQATRRSRPGQTCCCAGAGTRAISAAELLCGARERRLHEGQRRLQRLDVGAAPRRVLAQVTAEEARAWLAIEETQHGLGHGVERHAVGELVRHIVDVTIDRCIEGSRRQPEKARIDI